MVKPFQSINSKCDDPNCLDCNPQKATEMILRDITSLRVALAGSVVSAMSRRWWLSAAERRAYRAALAVVATHLESKS